MSTENERSPSADSPAGPTDRPQDPCRKLYDQAAAELDRLREMRVGDLVDGTLDWVKRYPGTGVTVAALVGFLVGRMIRR